MIVQCSHCLKKFKIPNSAAGKRIKCPSCTKPIVVPAEPVQSSPSKTESPAKKRPTSTSGQRPPKKSSSKKTSVGATENPAKSRPTKKRPSAHRQKKKTTKKRPAKKKRQRSPDLFDDFSGMSYGEDIEDYDNPYAPPKARGGRSKKKRRSTAGFGTAGAGLLLQGWSIVGSLVMFALLMVVSATRAPGLIAIVGIAYLGGLVLTAICLLVGNIMCLAVPAESGAKGWIICAVVFQLISVGMNLMMRMEMAGPELRRIEGIVGTVFFFTFLMFCRKIAGYAGHDSYATRATVLMIGIPVCLMVANVGAIMIPGLRGNPGMGVVVVVVGIALLIAVLLFGVMYLVLLFGLGSALRR